jgi:hypothetical protein
MLSHGFEYFQALSNAFGRFPLFSDASGFDLTQLNAPFSAGLVLLLPQPSVELSLTLSSELVEHTRLDHVAKSDRSTPSGIKAATVLNIVPGYCRTVMNTLQNAVCWQ